MAIINDTGAVATGSSLTLVATKSAANANSYATVAEADAYLNMSYGASEWASLSEDDKIRLLMSATKVIDKMPHIYSKGATAQALRYPIKNTGDAADTEGDGHTQAKEACIMQAFYLMQNNDAINEGINMAIQGIRQEGLSSISKVVTGFNPMRKYHPEVLKLMSAFVDFSIKLSRYESGGLDANY